KKKDKKRMYKRKESKESQFTLQIFEKCAKLIDFGESIVLKKEGRMTIVGTPFYEAPEGSFSFLFSVIRFLFSLLFIFFFFFILLSFLLGYWGGQKQSCSSHSGESGWCRTSSERCLVPEISDLLSVFL